MHCRTLAVLPLSASSTRNFSAIFPGVAWSRRHRTTSGSPAGQTTLAWPDAIGREADRARFHAGFVPEMEAIQFNRVICMSQKTPKEPLTFTARLVNSHHGFQDFDIDGHPVVRPCLCSELDQEGRALQRLSRGKLEVGRFWAGTARPGLNGVSLTGKPALPLAAA
ncbi:hypothetical protein L1887_47358 [Cichorium endivia]|nr:hypothetical protein L1887_47358 [Cichorium endivia]